MQRGRNMPLPTEKLKSFGINFAAVMATEIVRGFLREQIKNIKPEDLYNAIINDTDIWQTIPDDIKKRYS